MARRTSLYKDTRGVSLVEYALLLVAILLLVAGAWKLLGSSVRTQVECAANLDGNCASTGKGGNGSSGGGNGSSNGGGNGNTGGGNGGENGGANGDTNGGNGTGNESLGGDPGASAAADPSGGNGNGNGNGSSFGDQVRGQNGKPIDGDLAELSADVYNAGNGQPVNGYTRVSPSQLEADGINPSSLVDKSTGLTAAIYTDGKGNYVLAYAGTDPKSLKDWIANGKQGLGFDSAQYNQAVALAKDAKAAYGDNLVITGHSLGGGLASAAALATGSPAVTFNAAGLNNNTLEDLGLDPAAAREQAANGQIRRYAVDGEILTNIQEKNIATKHIAPDALGHKINLPDPDPLSWWQKPIPGSHTVHGVKLHLMDAVKESMKKNPQW